MGCVVVELCSLISINGNRGEFPLIKKKHMRGYFLNECWQNPLLRTRFSLPELEQPMRNARITDRQTALPLKKPLNLLLIWNLIRACRTQAFRRGANRYLLAVSEDIGSIGWIWEASTLEYESGAWGRSAFFLFFAKRFCPAADSIRAKKTDQI